ncbi:GNAT family N-acetyltransferase [Corynebacterium glyciniphilum]
MSPDTHPLSIVTTDRLHLRLHTRADVGALHGIYSQEDVARYLLDDPWTEEDAARHVADRCAKTGVDGGSGALAVVIERDGQVVGDVLLWWTDRERRIAEIGWVLDPAYGGQGLAREAVSAVLDLAFRRYRAHRVAAQMDARNAASSRLAAAVGMTREAHLRQDWWNKGEWTDTVIYGVLAEDRAPCSERL